VTGTISAWARRGATAVAAGRVAIGVVALAAPPLIGRPWVAEAADSTEGRVLARALGGRDLALGLGALAALGRRSTAARAWIGLAAVADTCDAVTTAVAWRELPASKWLVAASAAGAAAVGAAAVWSLAGEEPPGAA
jgi:hypothetical protein